MSKNIRLGLFSVFLFWSLLLFVGYEVIDSIGDTLVAWTTAHGLGWFFHLLQSFGLFVVTTIWLIGTAIMLMVWTVMGKAKKFEAMVQAQSDQTVAKPQAADIILTQDNDGVFR